MSVFSKIFPRSGLLLLSGNGIQSLVQSTLISQAESLLDAHRLDDLVALADRQRKKLESRVEVDADEAEELSYIYLLLGFQYFKETLFEDAGNNLFNGRLDPRILISYYPELRGNLFLSTDSTDLFAGIQERMPTEASVDEIIANYSPHLKPDTRSAPPTAELRKILTHAAQDMLHSFLRRWKSRDEVEPGQHSAQIRTIVDTVYVKLLAMEEKTGELYAMLQAEAETKTHFIVLQEVEKTLISNGQYNALTMLYRQRGADERCLELWAKLVDGTYEDPDVPIPTALSSIVSLLSGHKDKNLVNRYGVWMLSRAHVEQGFQLLTLEGTPPTSRRGRTKSRPKTTTEQMQLEEQEDLKLFQEVNETLIPPEAKISFLEWLTFGRRRKSSQFHHRLADSLLDRLFQSLTDTNTAKLWRAKASSFASSSACTTSTFFSYLSQSTPDSPAKRIRLKTILFLQGSNLYDFEHIRRRLRDDQCSSILTLEKAIVEGRLAEHRTTLSLLVRSLHDSHSAEAYCSLGGLAVVPPKTALSVAAQSEFVTKPSELAHGWTLEALEQLFTLKPVDEAIKRNLVRTLLEVYMVGEEEQPTTKGSKPRLGDRELASNLMNTQAMNLDVSDVVSIVPSSWPVSSMSSFLRQSFRRTVHSKYEGKIVKAICNGQNLQTKDEAWLILREAGMMVEEEEEEPDDGGDSELLDEKSGGGLEPVVVGVDPPFDEKVDMVPWTHISGRAVT